jgi:hypothetical protein
MFQKRGTEKIKTHILCSVNLFPENRAVYDKTWKNIVEWGQATDDNMAQVLCVLDH